MTARLNPPPTRYAQVGDADIAYKVAGSGPIDLLYFSGLGAHVDLSWDRRVSQDFYSSLASFSRLITFDRRGTGASDGVARSAIPTWEEWTEDVRAVLDAVGSERAAVVAQIDAGPIAVLFGATHPERVSALVLIGTTARYLVADDYPIGMSPESVRSMVELIARWWGTPEIIRDVPGLGDDAVEYLAMQARAAATPRTAAAQYQYLFTNLDVRPALPLVQAPTLVINSKENRLIPIEQGRYLADHIPGARFTEITGGGDTTIPADPSGAVAVLIEEFVTGERPAVEVERVLTTMLFTDIVGSTERAAALGDKRWRSVLDAHDGMVRDQLRLFRGREINTTGDGFLATFDGPARAIRCAQEVIEATEKLGIELRVGLHTGECEVRGDDLGGVAVHIAARVGALANPGEVLVSATVKDLVFGSGIDFEDRGEHELKGVPGSWRLFAVTG